MAAGPTGGERLEHQHPPEEHPPIATAAPRVRQARRGTEDGHRDVPLTSAPATRDAAVLVGPPDIASTRWGGGGAA